MTALTAAAVSERARAFLAAVTAAPEVLALPKPGEVIWRDDAGVTCRQWNWRQCTRTRIIPLSVPSRLTVTDPGFYARATEVSRRDHDAGRIVGG